MSGAGVLDLVGVNRSVSGHAILSDITLSLRTGEKLGLLGPNGSGKSTLLSIMAGLTRPQGGDVFLSDKPLQRHSRRAIAQRIACVAQHADTSDRLTVREAVELGRTPWLSALRPWGNEDEEAVMQALDVVGMSHMAARDWSTLSGGERQRVQIARAHAQSTPILLLDEPTNHLDIHHQISILDLVERLPSTIVIALHDMHHALRCDRVLVMDKGRNVALGPPAEVLTPDLIGEIFHVKASIIPDPAGGRPVFSFQSYT
jgi:iron complex transport system ATP-binding protein